MSILSFIKNITLKNIFPFGSVQKIRFGPLKGSKIIITENSGWSPLFNRWEPDILYWFTKIIKPNDVVYDLGANNGLHSLLASKLVGNSGKVFSFEPLPQNIDEIQLNFEKDSVRNCKIVKLAVSDKSQDGLIFKVGKHNKQGSIDGIGCETGNEISISSITLDDFIAQGNQIPDFIKIDIEGAESKALRGFSKNISKHYPSMIIDLHTPEQDLDVGVFLSTYGYNVFRITKQNNLKKIVELTKPWPNPDGIWGSILAIHPSKNLTI